MRSRPLRRDATACPACEHWAILISPAKSPEQGELHFVADSASGAFTYTCCETPSRGQLRSARSSGRLANTFGLELVENTEQDIKIHPLFKFLPLSLRGIRASIASVSPPPPPRPLILPELDAEARGSQEWVVQCLKTLEDDYGGAFVTINQCDWWEDMVMRSALERRGGERVSMESM